MRYYPEGTEVFVCRLQNCTGKYKGIIVGAPLNESLSYGQAYIVKQIDPIPGYEKYSCLTVSEISVEPIK